VEILDGLADDSTVVTLGSASLRDGDPIVIAGQAGRGARGGAEGGREGGQRGGGAGEGAARGGQRPGGGA
jgi:hypothetical protein